MNRIAFSLLMGSLALSSALAKTANNLQKSLEDEAWGSSASAASRKTVKKTKAKAKAPQKATVTVHEITAKVAKPASAAKEETPKHAEATLAKDDQSVPLVPADFGSEMESKSYRNDIQAMNASLSKLLGAEKTTSKSATELQAAIALQPLIDRALSDPNLKPERKSMLNDLVLKRDTALYMYSEGLIVQKKKYDAADYLRFLAKNASSSTPMRDACMQQLNQLSLGMGSND